VARFHGREALASVATLMILLLLVIVPLLGFLGIVVAQAYELSQDVIPWFQESIKDPSGQTYRLPEWIPFVDKLSSLVDRLRPYTSQIFAKAGELTGKVGTFLVSSLSAGTRGTAVFFLNLFIMLYAMFFFLMHGPAIRQRLLSYSPLSQEDKDRLLEKGLSVTRATVKGTLVIGIVQGGLGGLAFAVVGIRGAAFWATIMAVLSVIPGVGTAFVWVPAVIYLLIKGQIVAGVGLLIWSVAVVGSVDNVLRPRLVGGDTQMPDLLILLSTLGGLSLFGAIGLIVGPLIAALFLTVWDIYRVSFRDLLPAGAEAIE
jgi:predicted PurR-regulated permease PerM